MNKLKPCPFCGSKAHIQRDVSGTEAYHVVCDSLKCKCPMIGGMPWRKTQDEAKVDWNKRADSKSNKSEARHD